MTKMIQGLVNNGIGYSDCSSATEVALKDIVTIDRVWRISYNIALTMCENLGKYCIYHKLVTAFYVLDMLMD